MPNFLSAQAPIPASVANFGPAQVPAPADGFNFGPAGYGVSAVVPPILFCTPLALTLAPVQQFTTTIINGSDVVFSGTSDGVDIAVSGVSVGTFQLLGGDVWFEWTITSANANAGIGNCPNAFIAPPPFAEGVVVVVNAAGTEFEMYKCSDIFAAPPPLVAPQNPDFINKTLNFPYTVQTRMNGTTGEITWEDTNGNSGSLGNWIGILTENLDITMLGFGNTLALTQVDASYSVNAGRAAPVITPPLGFDTWCSYFVPPIVCTPSVFTLQSDGNPQTVVITGNLAEGTSLGNSGVSDGISSDQSWVTGTKVVHLEMRLEKHIGNVGTNQVFGIVLTDAETQPFNILMGVAAIPDFGFLIDIVSGSPLGFTAFPDGSYVLGLWIDGNTGIATARDNISVTGNLQVDPLWNNALPIYMGSPFGAGSTLGAELDVRFNFEGTFSPTVAFELNPQNNKWCDPDVVNPFCAPVTLTNFPVINAQDVVINPVTNQITETATASFAGSSQSFQGATETFTSQSAVVPIEVTFDSCSQTNNARFVGCGFSQGANIAGAAFSPSLGQVIDIQTNAVLETGLSIPDGAALMVEFDSQFGTVSYKCDSLGVIGTAASLTGYNNLNPVGMTGMEGLSNPITIGEELIYTLNTGYKPFTNTTTGTLWCDI